MEGGTAGAHAFVGRARELSALDGALAHAAGGRGRLFLIGGEPGIGKTSLADELTSRASARGMRSLWGRCWEGGAAPAYWPWTQIFRSVDTPGDAASELAPILNQTGDQPDPASGAARFRVFDAAAAILRRAAERSPLLLVFDDMHAADESSLLLLRFCARELGTAPILMLCTYREAEVRLQPAIASQFADLSRDAGRLRLGGWDAEEVAECLRLHEDERLAHELGPAIQRLTEGNPFFVKEVAREIAAGLLQPAALLDEAMPMPLPDGVRETIQRRLALLPEEVLPLLRLAALIGREFDAAELQRLASQRAPLALSELVALLTRAVAAGLIAEVRDRVGSYSFSHALVRETLRHQISPIERMSLHLAIGEALESAGAREEMASRLAFHFFQANAAGGAAKAVHYARLAADAAQRGSAYEGAAALYQRALDALRFLPPDEPRRCELLIALGRAQRRAGRIPEARAAFRRGGQLARDIANPELAASAALGFGNVGETGKVDTDLVGLLEDSLSLLGEADSPLRSRALARLAMALYFSTDPADRERREAMSAGALAMARRLQDREALGAALVARHFVLWRPGTTGERLALSAELIELALAMRDEELELEARLWHTLDLLESGDGPGYAAAAKAFRGLADTARLPIYEWHVLTLDSMWALACGDLDAAERAAESARDLGGKYHIERAAQFYAAQTFFARRERGDLADLEPALRAFADQFAALPVWRCGLALLYAEIGRTAEAQRALAAALAVDPGAWQADGSWLPCLAMLAEVCAKVGDRERATKVWAWLEPYADTHVVLFDGIALLGPADHYLGLLAAALNDAAGAARHLDAAVHQCERLGATALAERSRRARSGLTTGPQAPAPAASAPVASGRMVFRREGAYWTIAFAGRESRLKSMRGLVYIAHLLQHPGEEFHALELAAIGAGGAEAPAANAVSSTADLSRRRSVAAAPDEMIDAQAKAEYRQRLRDLHEDLAEAEERNDRGRVELLQEEMEALTAELSRALGIGGRTRLAASDTERARVAVTKAITLALKAIGEHDPELRRYLGRAIKTGTFCGYRGDPAEAKRWELDR